MGKENCAVPWERGKSKKRVSKKRKNKNVAADSNTIIEYIDEQNLGLEQLFIPDVELELLGDFHIKINGKNLPKTKWGRKPRLLFIMLVLAQGRELTRTFICKQLWPSFERQRAIDNMYSTLTQLTNLLGSKDYIEKNGEYISIKAETFKCDVFDFEALSRKLLTQNLSAKEMLKLFLRLDELYKGDFLETEYKNEYFINQRERYRSIYIDSMISACYKSLELKDSALALWFSRKALEKDSKREDVYYALMCAQISAGQRCSAINTYHRCLDFLRQDLGLDPSMQMQNLYEQLILENPNLKVIDGAVKEKLVVNNKLSE
ncbi:MAG: hypothetical protein MJ189_00625 [Coriobacteriales bacterium]|nr:hypothetical protein [Coriobacteriales bacterium]